MTTAVFDSRFAQLDRETQVLVKAWIDKNLMDCGDPHRIGKPLQPDRNDQWQYQAGGYRIFAKIQNEALVLVDIICL